MVNLNGIISKPAGDGKATLTRKCPWCGKEHSITAKQDELLRGLDDLSRGGHIQDAFPTWTPSEREFLMTGVCSKCWDNM